MGKPNFKEPGKSAFEKLLKAVVAVNAVVGDGAVDDDFVELMDKAAEAADSFRKKEVDIDNFVFRRADRKIWKAGAVETRSKLVVEFDYYEDGNKKHYVSP